MKKVLVILVLASFCCSLAAQETKFIKHVSIGAGYSYSMLRYNEDNQYPRSLSGFNVFAQYDKTLNKTISLSAGLRFSSIGYFDSYKLSAGQVKTKETWKQHYVQVPFKFTIHVKGVYLALGPTIDFCVGSSFRQTIKDGAQLVSDKRIKYLKLPDSGGFESYNLAASGELGYEKNHIRVFGGYEYMFFPIRSLDGSRTRMIGEIRGGIAYRF